eukprot:6558991-Prorocentrum_lima.AAC.1
MTENDRYDPSNPKSGTKLVRHNEVAREHSTLSSTTSRYSQSSYRTRITPARCGQSYVCIRTACGAWRWRAH